MINLKDSNLNLLLSARIRLDNINESYFNFSSLVTRNVMVKLYTKRFDKIFYTTNLVLNKDVGYYISHPCLLNEKELYIDFIYTDKIDTIHLNEELLSSNKAKSKNVLVKVSCPALGDTLCSTPTIRKISESYGHKIDVMTRRPDVFENNPYIENIIEYSERDIDVIEYKEVFETYNQHYKLNKNMGNTEYYDKPMEVKLSNFEARQLHAMGVGITLYPDEMEYDYTPNEQTDISKIVDKNFIVLHVTENWPVRTWSVKKWQELADRIKSETNYKIVTIGKAHEEDGYFGKIDKGVIKLNNIDLDTCLYTNVGKQDHVQLGEGSLSELWHIINNAKALISFDSGPVHLAGTTDTHIIQIGSSIRYEKTAPYRKGSQKYKFDFVGGECELFCASTLRYSVKEWGTINSMPYYPECQEKYTEFKCHPSVDQVFKKLLEI